MISMVAVMLGAFEHESLLLQEDPPPAMAPVPESDATTSAAAERATDTPPEAASAQPHPAPAGKHWTKAGADTGTEGTFRSETQVFWTPSAGDFFVLWRVPEFGTAFACTGVPPHLGQHARAHVSGVRALRL